jgi:hypothetical protein
MKMKKLILFLGILATAISIQAQTIDATNIAGIMSRLESVEASNKKLTQDMAFQSRDLDLKLKEAVAKTQTQFWGLLMAILLAFASGPLAVFLRSKLDKKVLLEAAANKAREEMDRVFPDMATAAMKSFLDKEVPARVKTILDMSKIHEDEVSLQYTTKIVVIADSLELGEKRAQYLRDQKFKDVRVSLPKPLADMEPCDVCFVEHPGQEGSYTLLSNKYLESLLTEIAKNPQKAIFTFVPFPLQRLNYTLLSQKGFANSESQIQANLMRLIQQIKKP